MGSRLSKKWKAAAVSALLPHVKHMSPEMLSMLAWSLGKLGFRRGVTSAAAAPVAVAAVPCPAADLAQQQQLQQEEEQQRSEYVVVDSVSDPGSDTCKEPTKVCVGLLLGENSQDSAKGKGLGRRQQQQQQQLGEMKLQELHAVLLSRAQEVCEGFSSRELVMLLVGEADMEVQPEQQWLQQMLGGRGARGKAGAAVAGTGAAAAAGHGGNLSAAAGAAPAAEAGGGVQAAEAGARREEAAAVAAAGGGMPTGGWRAEGAAAAAATATRSATAPAEAAARRIQTAAWRKAAARVVDDGKGQVRLLHTRQCHQSLSQFPGVLLVLLLRSLAQLGFRGDQGWLEDVEVLLEVAWLEEERWARYSGAWALGRLKQLAAAGSAGAAAAPGTEGKLAG
jgi:hypothetical protein